MSDDNVYSDEPINFTNVLETDGTKSENPEMKSNGATSETKSDDIKPKDDANENENASTKSQSGEHSDETTKEQQPQNQQRPSQKQSRKFKVVDQNNNRSPFTSSGEFTEEQLVKMYRQMQADRARTQQLLSHVTSPYAMHGSAGESVAMAAGAFVGFALGRTMYKASRIGHLRQDWRLRREVLRQERGYYNQGAQGRFGGILSGFTNSASAFAQGWRRGTRSDIKMDMQQETPQRSAEKVVVNASEETTEKEPTVEREVAC